MNLQLAAFSFGALLIAVGILGGGLQIKELTVPKIGTFSRLLSGAVGIIFIIVGYSSETPTPPPITPLPSASRDGITKPLTLFTITSQLGKLGNAEEIEFSGRVYINGEKVAEIFLNSQTPSRSVSAQVLAPGIYNYVIEGYSLWNITEGRRVPLYGAGTIDVAQGAVFAFEADDLPTPTMQTWNNKLRPPTP